MSIEKQLRETLLRLTPDQQLEVLRFVEMLAQQEAEKKPFRDVAGALADLNIHLTAEEIDQARREMWGPYMGHPQP